MYASRLLNKIKQNYSTTKRKALVMVFVLHKFRHYLLGNKFIFYVDHMALVYLVNKPHVSERIGKWSLLFIKYDFKVVYKLAKIHEVANALLKLPNITKAQMVMKESHEGPLGRHFAIEIMHKKILDVGY